MDKKFSRFGKYLILDHLVDGGMAKICRASYLGEQANKIVAIKMVQPQYSKNPSFVQMFEDELKVTFGLVHPNIAQVFDYGLVDNQLYSAMEYVDGANLKQFLDRLKEKKFVFPVEISTHIISQVCQALHYAHTFTDKLTGKNFNIIHRDISPHNIMLTYEGAIKVIDFGIAKADSNSENTQAGTIKGKLSYLAPEYLDGLELDHRYDQFAVGITLWEMLCSRKLFKAKNDLAVLKQIQTCNIPTPSSINPNVPKELDEIVLKCLAKDRNQRFENLDKLNRSLVRFLYSNYPDFNATDLSYFAKQLFKEEILADRKKFVSFGKIDIRPYLDDLRREENGGSSSNQKGDLPASGSFISEEQRTGKIELDLGNFDNQTSTIQGLDLDYSDSVTATIKKASPISIKKKVEKIEAPEKREKTNKIRTKRTTSSGRTVRTRVRSTTSGRRGQSNKRAKAEAGRKSQSSLILVASLALIAVSILNWDSIQGMWKKDLQRTPGSTTPVSQISPESTNTNNTAKIGYIYLSNLSYADASNMKIFVNNKIETLKGTKHKIALNTPIKIKLTKDGYKPFEYPKEIVLTEQNSTITIQVPSLVKEYYGFLSTSKNYPPGSVIEFEENGELKTRDLPLSQYRLPAGTYDFVIKNKFLPTEQKVRFTVEKNKKNQLPKNL